MQKTVFSLWYWCKQRCFHLLITEVCIIKPVVDTYQAMLGTQDREFRHWFHNLPDKPTGCNSFPRETLQTTM